MGRGSVFGNRGHGLRKEQWLSSGASEGASRRALLTAETPYAESAPSPDEQLRLMADDEIAVDGHVMKPEARGASRVR